MLNQNGEVVSGATVSLGGSSATTGDNGKATFTKPSVSSTTLTVSCTDYYDYSQPSYGINAGNGDTISIKARSLSSHKLAYAYYTNVLGLVQVDLITKSKKVNMSTSNMDFNLKTAVTGDADKVSRYELRQKVNGVDKMIASSPNGTFTNLQVKLFTVGTGVYVTVYDKDGHQTSTALNFEVGENPNYTKSSELSLGDGISFALGDNIPIFGGSSFDFDIGSLPISYKETGDSIRIGFNIAGDYFDDDMEFKGCKQILDEMSTSLQTKQNQASYARENYKKLVQKLKQRQNKKGLMSMTGFDKGMDFTVAGYVETGFDGAGKVSEAKGYISLTVQASAEFDWQLVVIQIPVAINVKGEITAELASSVTYSVTQNKLTGEISLTMEPSLKVKAGVGFKYLSAGVYGEAGLSMKMSLGNVSEHVGLQSVDMTSSIGVYATAAFFTYEKDLATGTFNLWTRGSDNKTAARALNGKTASTGKTISTGQPASTGKTQEDINQDLTRGLYDLQNYSLITRPDGATMKTSGTINHSTIARNLAYGATPSVASTRENALMVFASQDEMGGNNTVCSKLYYSYHGDGNSYWKSASLLDSTKVTNELNPQVITDEINYYVLYQETNFSPTLFDGYANKSEAEKAAVMKTAFKSIDIHAKKYNTSTETFTDLGTISTPGYYDYNLSGAVVNGKLNVWYACNSSGDFFGSATPNSNYIYKAVYSGTSWSATRMHSGLNAVTQLAAGITGETPIAMYAEDGDNDLTTTQDCNLYYNNGSSRKVATGDVSQISFAPVLNNAVAKQFYVGKKDGLYKLNSSYGLTQVFAEADNYADEYAITPRGVYYTRKLTDEDGRDCVETFARYALTGGAVSQAVAVTHEEEWQRDVSAITIDNEDYLVSLEDTYDGDGVSTDLFACKCNSYYDLAIASAMVNDGADIVPGDTTAKVAVDVTNKGNQVISGETLEISDGNGHKLDIAETDYSVALTPGETKTITVTALLGEDTRFDDWTVRAEFVENTYDEHSSDNKVVISVGHSDFTVDASVCGAGAYQYLLIQVQNQGTVSDSAKLQLLNANDMTQELESESIDNLDSDSVEIFKVKLEKDWIDSRGKISVLANVSAGDKETYTYNNYAYAYATLNYGQYNISYVLNGGTNATGNKASYTTTDAITFAKPARTGYTFVGWYTSAKFETITQTTGIAPGSAGDVTVYAKWKSNSAANDASSYVGKTVKGSSGCSYKVKSKTTVTIVKAPASVKSVSIGSSVVLNSCSFKVTAIGANAFKNKKKLKKVTIGSNVKTIGKYAFYGCKNLKSVTIKTTKLTTKTVGTKAFGKINSRAKVKVPKSRLKAYKKLLKKRGLTGKKQIVRKS